MDKYILKVGEYRSLIDVTCEVVQLSQADIDYLYSVVDYGSMSTTAASDRFGQHNQDIPAGSDSTYQDPDINRDGTMSDAYDSATLGSGMPPFSPSLGRDFDFDFSNIDHSQQDPEFYAQFFTDLALST